MPTVRQKWAYFLAFLFVALALGPSLAHLLELPRKMALTEADYFTVQGIYRGWAWLGAVIIAALVSTLALAVVVRGRGTAGRWAAAAFGCLAAGQAVFWAFTFPANRATGNWTTVPADWAALRTQWELSHAAGAGLNLLAMVALILSVLAFASAGRPPGRS